jgi:hypothetical protein
MQNIIIIPDYATRELLHFYSHLIQVRQSLLSGMVQVRQRGRPFEAVTIYVTRDVDSYPEWDYSPIRVVSPRSQIRFKSRETQYLDLNFKKLGCESVAKLVSL